MILSPLRPCMRAGRTRLLIALLPLGGLPAAAQTATGWAALGSGVPGAGVGELAFGPDGLLYVGGGFSQAGGVPSDGVATWNGSAWATLGEPSEGGGSCAFAFPGAGHVFAGGPQTLSGIRVNGIAEWDGAGWNPLGFGLLRHEGRIEDEDFYIASACALTMGIDGNLYAGGDFTLAWDSAGPEAAGRVASWDGSLWTPVGGTGLALADGGWAVVRALVFGPDGRLYAGGEFSTADGQSVANVAAWDGTAWDDLGGGLSSASVYALAFGPDGRLYASGILPGGTVGGVETDLAAWDGTTWRAVGPPVQGGFYTLAFAPDGKLYAGGFFTLPGGSQHIARLDHYLAGPGAGVWVSLGGVRGQSGGARVNALAVGPQGEVYVGGTFSAVGSASVAANNVAVWLGDRVVSAEEPAEASALLLSVSPNPARGASTVSVTLGSSSAVRVVVADVLGREVAVVHDGPLAAGTHTLAVDVSRWPAGVYAVRAEAGDASAATERLTVVR